MADNHDDQNSPAVNIDETHAGVLSSLEGLTFDGAKTTNEGKAMSKSFTKKAKVQHHTMQALVDQGQPTKAEMCSSAPLPETVTYRDISVAVVSALFAVTCATQSFAGAAAVAIASAVALTAWYSLRGDILFAKASSFFWSEYGSDRHHQQLQPLLRQGWLRAPTLLRRVCLVLMMTSVRGSQPEFASMSVFLDDAHLGGGSGFWVNGNLSVVYAGTGSIITRTEIYPNGTAVLDANWYDFGSASGGNSLNHGKGIAVTSDGALLFASTYGDYNQGRLHKVNTASKTHEVIMSGLIFPAGIAINKANTKLYLAILWQQKVVEVDIATGASSNLIVGNDQNCNSNLDHPNGVAFSPDEELLYVTNSGGYRYLGCHRVRVVNITSGESWNLGGQQDHEVLRQPTHISVSPDGRFVYVTENTAYKINSGGGYNGYGDHGKQRLVVINTATQEISYLLYGNSYSGSSVQYTTFDGFGSLQVIENGSAMLMIADSTLWRINLTCPPGQYVNDTGIACTIPTPVPTVLPTAIPTVLPTAIPTVLPTVSGDTAAIVAIIEALQSHVSDLQSAVVTMQSTDLDLQSTLTAMQSVDSDLLSTVAAMQSVDSAMAKDMSDTKIGVSRVVDWKRKVRQGTDKLTTRRTPRMKLNDDDTNDTNNLRRT